MPSFRNLVQNVAAACKPKSRKSNSDPANHPLAKLSQSGGSFSRLNLSLASTLQKTKRALRRQEPEEEEEEDWGCFEAMAISRSPTLQLSKSSPTLASSPSSSNTSYCISDCSDYFSMPRSRSEDSDTSLNSIITAYSTSSDDYELAELLACPITPKSSPSTSGSPSGSDAGRSFPSTPILSCSPALPSLPRLPSFEKTMQEAITDLEMTVQKVATSTATSISSRQAALYSYEQPVHVEYAFEESTSLPEDYESDSGSDESFSCEGLDLSDTPESLVALSELSDRLRLDYGFASCSELMLRHSRCRSAVSMTEEFVLHAHVERETRYNQKILCQSRNKSVTKSKPTSLLAMQASIRSAALMHGMPRM